MTAESAPEIPYRSVQHNHEHDSVSAVIPTYNYEQFVCEAVESALAQTHKGEMEVIVVDDGSKDGTRKVLEPYGDRIRYIYQDNKGLSAARNTGIRAAKGKWIALLDSDDAWHPRKTEVQLRTASRYGGYFGLIGSMGVINVPMPESLPEDPPLRALSVRDFLSTTPFPPSGALIQRRCFEDVGLFDESLRAAEDRDIWLRVSARFPAAVIDCPCNFYREHAGQMSRKADRMHKAYLQMITGFFDDHPELLHHKPLAMGFMNRHAALAFLEENERKEAILFLLASLREFPVTERAPVQEASLRLKVLARLLMGEKLFRKLAGPAT